MLQHMYIKKLNKLKLKDRNKIEKNVANKFKQSKRWIYSNPAEWKKFAQHVEIPRKLEMSQQQENPLIEQLMSPKSLSVNNPDTNLSVDTEIVKITTVIETIRQKRQRSANVPKETKDIERTIGKKRSKRSSRKSDYSEDAQRARKEILSIMNKRSRYPRKEDLPTRKRASDDLKVANNIPSTVFYKRIWEYINGTRPHSDIASDYDSSQNHLEKKNSTCTDRDRITASQSRMDELQARNPDIKPERELYKRIWDIINATKLTYEDSKARSKRNADIQQSDAFATVSAQLCAQEKNTNLEENKQATNKRATLDITDTIDSREVPDPGSYVSNFWIVANKTQWNPKRITPVNIAKLNSMLLPNVASASEVDDLNKFPDKVQSNADYSSSNNSTDYVNESHNQSQAITEPGPPYSSKEEDTTVSSYSSTVETLQTAHSKSYAIDTTPIYDISNIPYVEVPDYSDKRENSLDKNNQSSAIKKYKEYDDNDYVDPEQLYSVEHFSSNSPDIESNVEHNIQATNDESATPLNVSQSNCVENKDSTECIKQESVLNKYNVEDAKLNNNTKNDTSNVVQHSAENSAESVERENSTEEFVHFDINEYRKPFKFEFIDPTFKHFRGVFNKETQEEEKKDTKHDKEARSNNSGESEEYEEYATYPKKKYTIYNNEENSNHKEESAEYEKYFIYPKEEKEKHDSEENANDTEKSEETYARYPKEDTKHDTGENPNLSEEKYEIYATYGKEKNITDDSEEIPSDNTKSEEYEAYGTYTKEKNNDDKKNLEQSKESEEYETYPKEELYDYSTNNKDYHGNPTYDEKGETKEKIDVKDGKQISEISDKNQYVDKDFFKHIFGEDRNKESSDKVDTKREFLSRYFTEDVLRKMQENSKEIDEDKQKEESKNREEIHKTLSEILDKKDRYSRLDENLDKMIEKGEAVPIRYNNFWSLEYQSPKNIEIKEKEEA